MRHLWVQIQAYFRPQNLIASISVIWTLKSHSLRLAITFAQSLGYELAENETYVQPFERSSWPINKKRYNCAFIALPKNIAYSWQQVYNRVKRWWLCYMTKQENCLLKLGITFCCSLVYCRKKTKSSFERIAFCIKMCYNVI